MNEDFLARLHANIATLAIGASTLRNQGAPGVVAAARRFLSGVSLDQIVVNRPEVFASRLDELTKCLQCSLPDKTRHWGAARKAVNLFLRDALYNTYLSSHFGLATIREWLEVPLDSLVAAGLCREQAEVAVPTWPGLKHLTPTESTVYQQVALCVADRHSVARVDLDLWYWNRDASGA